MKRWSFDVRSGGPSQAGILEREKEQTLKEPCRYNSLDGRSGTNKGGLPQRVLPKKME